MPGLDRRWTLLLAERARPAGVRKLLSTSRAAANERFKLGVHENVREPLPRRLDAILQKPICQLWPCQMVIAT